MLRCPVCRSALRRDPAAKAWGCGGGHHFDEAREGYVNLLITHQRRKRDPGDSPDMLRHRRSLLDAGTYAPIAEALAAVARPAAGMNVLDAGCGEGYYTSTWPQDHDGLRLAGIDIAKPAVRMAAKRAAAGSVYAVGSVYDLPVLDGAVDLVVSVFAPLHSPEFERVLRPGGRLVVIGPGPDHLAGLKALLFDEPEDHPETGPFERDGATTILEAEGTTRVRADVHLDSPEAVADLVHMTPYAWYVAPEVRQAVVARGSLDTPIDVLVSAYRHP